MVRPEDLPADPWNDPDEDGMYLALNRAERPNHRIRTRHRKTFCVSMQDVGTSS
jgi:hypothetical protein